MFDVILIDAYRGPFVPFHLLTSEFYKLVAAHLKPGGVAVQNVEPTTMLFDSAVATIKSAFEHVVFISECKGTSSSWPITARKRTTQLCRSSPPSARRKYKFRYDLPKLWTRRFAPQWNESTKPLTDDFAPVEYLKAIERHNEKQT